jgi:predicted nucleic acid-binding protein
MSKQIVVDTNVLVSFLTDRDPVQQEQVAALFRGAAAGAHALILHQIALSEMVYVLLNLYGVSPVEVARILADLLAMPGIQPVHELSWPLLLGLWPATIPSFSDAALAAVAKQGVYDEVATFDRSLAKRLKRQGVPTCW